MTPLPLRISQRELDKIVFEIFGGEQLPFERPEQVDGFYSGPEVEQFLLRNHRALHKRTGFSIGSTTYR